MNTELLPCPFCGGEAEYYIPHTHSVVVGCTKCSATMTYKISADYSAKDECIKAWNQRVDKSNKSFKGCKGCLYHYYNEDEDKSYCTNTYIGFEIDDVKRGCFKRIEI